MGLEALCARDLMTKKIVVAERHETLRVAARRMSEHGIHSLLITPESPTRGYSILTGKDCIRVIADSGEAALDELCVEDAMTQPAVTLPAGLCITDCIQLMRLTGVRTAPILESERLVGVLTFTDVLSAVTRGEGG
ncbi:MAG: CBS domain-containing protein [Deltaproteobacteria bacterium]|nr:CBS domain-containing protein [Deltaproteobacteria bacterium]MBW2394855.1 CBS domain-containing protein [Deltaproteobacteria bacterium]